MTYTCRRVVPQLDPKQSCANKLLSGTSATYHTCRQPNMMTCCLLVARSQWAMPLGKAIQEMAKHLFT